MRKQTFIWILVPKILCELNFTQYFIKWCQIFTLAYFSRWSILHRFQDIDSRLQQLLLNVLGWIVALIKWIISLLMKNNKYEYWINMKPYESLTFILKHPYCNLGRNYLFWVNIYWWGGYLDPRVWPKIYLKTMISKLNKQRLKTKLNQKRHYKFKISQNSN